MAIVYVKGDLITAPEPIIVHGCNAQGVMGSGVAKAVREAYPQAYDDYHTAHLKNGLTLGQVVWTYDSGTRVIANAITQENYGRDGQKYVSYDAVDKAFYEISSAMAFSLRFLEGYERKIAVPRIGAGLGGGNWDIIAAIIVANMGDIDVTVYDL